MSLLSDSPASPEVKATHETLEGIVERLTYHADDSGWTVAWLQVPGARELLKIVGSFASVQPGQTFRLTGYWRNDHTHGRQFHVLSQQELRPATLTGLEKYLGSGLIKGVGPATARKIVAHFGLETLEVLEEHSERLLEVPGISHKRLRRIQAAWAAQKIIQEVMLFLGEHGVSTTYAAKIFKCYGQDAIAIVTRNPYQLAEDIYGIGFLSADKIARQIGIAPESEFRLRAGIQYVLSSAAEDGHCFLPEPELVARVVEQLTLPDHPVDVPRLQTLVAEMAEAGELVRETLEGDQPAQRRWYHPAFFQAESHLAQRLLQLTSRPVEVDLERVRRWIDRFMEQTGVTLTLQQRQAVELAAQSRVLILTGGPGCGKTFTTRAITQLWKAMGKSLALAAPTGRAAQRLSELTGYPAQTLHRLLAFDPGTRRFRHTSDRPLNAHAVVVDEVSMLDLFLAHALVRAIPGEAHLLLVGDSDQLPSVGPGNILRDLIASEQLPVIRLTEIFRQAQTSQIVMAAHQIRQGQKPTLHPLTAGAAEDFLWVDAPDPEQGQAAIRTLLQTELPRRGIDPRKALQVLSPMTRGAVGTHALNELLQPLLNPPGPHAPQVSRGGLTARPGDRVIQQVNNYELEVFNGDIGVVTSLNQEEQTVTIQFAERSVVYDEADLSELALAWAVTVHKAQGSEYPVVILPLYPQHYPLLSRNLLYTALTRAKGLAILVGPAKAVAMAVRRVEDQQRYTALGERLRNDGKERVNASALQRNEHTRKPKEIRQRGEEGVNARALQRDMRARQPKETEPHMVIDPLKPAGENWMWAEATQGDVQARIALRPAGRYRGYVLTRYTDRVEATAPGKMGRKQEARAKVLLGVLEARLLEAMQAAGWSIMTHTPQGGPVWRFTPPLPVPTVEEHLPRQMVTQQRAHGLAPYRRTVQMRLVTFTCAWCQQEVTQQRYPGKPRYCSEPCEKEATRAKTRTRVQRLRAKQQKG